MWALRLVREGLMVALASSTCVQTGSIMVEWVGMRCESLFLEEPVTLVKFDIREKSVFGQLSVWGLRSKCLQLLFKEPRPTESRSTHLRAGLVRGRHGPSGPDNSPEFGQISVCISFLC